MSKAFVNEDVEEPELDTLPVRTGSSPITERGLRELTQELGSLSGTESRRARQLEQILASVVVQQPALRNGGAGFGCIVDVQHEDGTRRTYEIVGADESDPARGRISVSSPIARALYGQKRGAFVVVEKPSGDEELEILDVRLPPSDDE